MRHEADMEESVIGDFLMGKGRFTPPRQLAKDKVLRDARDIERLEIFLPDHMPDDAYDLWFKMSAGGKRFSQYARPNESPKVTYNRFVSKKREEYNKKRKQFRDMYGHDYKELDMQATQDMSVDPVWRAIPV